MFHEKSIGTTDNLLVGDVFVSLCYLDDMSEISLKKIKTMIEDSIFIGKLSALLSFLIGTILFGVFTFFIQSILMFKIGVIYILISLIVNTFIFIHLLYQAYFNPKYRLELIKTCGIMLLNIPITIGYLYLIVIIDFNPIF